jgi:hypothetical protein
MQKIFISCSSKAGKAGLTICNAIEARGHACWISGRDVRPGENFQEAIVNAISNSGLTVLVFSANANNSDEIKKEIALASQSKIAVIPVRIEDVLPSAALSSKQPLLVGNRALARRLVKLGNCKCRLEIGLGDRQQCAANRHHFLLYGQNGGRGKVDGWRTRKLWPHKRAIRRYAKQERQIAGQ